MDRRIIVLAHNIRSLWNVGSLFRTADAFNIEKLILSGYTPLPPRREIDKTALGAQQWITWQHVESPVATLTELRNDGWECVALEITSDAGILSEYQPSTRTCLVVGHEVTGVPDDVLHACSRHVCIPMIGQKESLNVSVAAGIALHHVRYSFTDNR